MAKTSKVKKSKVKRPGRNYKNGQGPCCGNCGTVGHYAKTCPSVGTGSRA